MSNINDVANLKGLIVPVDIAAFCVGDIDAHESTGSFAGCTLVYDKLISNKNEAFLGANAMRSFSDAPWNQMEKGIHLHWALPDGLTRASSDTGSLVFPAVPNRWLLTRLLIQGKVLTPKTWIIESDTISKTLAEGQNSVTIPVKSSDGNGIESRYIGVWKEFDSNWVEPNKKKQVETIKSVTGNELNAVTNGDVSFGSFYPNSRNVFGFCDSLEDLKLSDDKPVELMYILNGWFSDLPNDPITNVESLELMQETYKWTFDKKDSMPSYTIYNGVVQNIKWNPKTKYIYQQGTLPSLKAEVALGNTSAEAMAAYFRDKDHSDVPVFESLLAAFQTDMLSTFSKQGQMAELVEGLQKKQFSSTSGGNIYSIVEKKKTAPTDNDDQDTGSENINLPLKLAYDLDVLNKYQQQNDIYQYYIEEYKWQLFSDWYRIFEANDDSKNTAYMTAMHRYKAWKGIKNTLSEIQSKLKSQLTVVQNQLGDSLELKTMQAPSYLQPNEPVMLLVGDEISPALCYGGDGRYNEDGYLVCRSGDNIASMVSIAGQEIPASQFDSIILKNASNLPYPEIVNALLKEACIINTSIAANITGKDATTLRNALYNMLIGKGDGTYLFKGQAPSPITIKWWDKNPWLPIFAHWTASFQPLQPTVSDKELKYYTDSFFTSNYTINPDSPAFTDYTPDGTSGSIDFDPASAKFTQVYDGVSVLTPGAAKNFLKKLDAYLLDHSNPTLQKVADQLKEGNMLMQAMSGFNSCLLMRKQGLQFNIMVPKDNEYIELTEAIADIVGNGNVVMPFFNGYYNPIRAGYMKLSLEVIDAYGQRRKVDFDRLICSDSMTTYYKQKKEESIAYLPPRLAQPSRLLFRWLNANSSELSEMNSHPATSPICGWLMPNHLDGSFFLYNSQGKALGNLYPNGDNTAIEWQSAPGDDDNINKPIEEVLRYENPQLKELGITLKKGSIKFFKDFYKAVDTIHNSINPLNPLMDQNIAVLIGRPVAIAQVSLRLEVKGSPAINQSWLCFDDEGNYIETDNGYLGVQFPVLMGDVQKLDDGLIGYFKQSQDSTGYDLNTFYTKGASADTASGVVVPNNKNILLTATPKINKLTTTEIEKYTEKLLMLIDPRAKVHATMGIMPVKSIQIPPDQYVDTLSMLEMTFLTSPVLKGYGGISLPLPQEGGYQWSWMEEAKNPTGQLRWTVTPGVDAVYGNGISQYTPQLITEGWLRLNPMLLEFNLLDKAGKPVIKNNALNAMTLHIVNKKGVEITFVPGQLVEEGGKKSGSIFYIHLAGLVASDDISSIVITAPGWDTKLMSSSKYGDYWAMTPSYNQPIKLEHGESISMKITNLKATSSMTQAQVYFDYYDIDGLNDGVYEALVTLEE